MPLAPGTRLGPHEIIEPIGSGGMGEVYRARDTRLERMVAVKVLPAHLSDNEERRQRFDREAKTISALSHPHRRRYATTPIGLFKLPLFEGPDRQYEISADGSRVLANVLARKVEARPLIIVLNWTGELKK